MDNLPNITVSKTTASWLYYPGIIIIIITHLILLTNPELFADPNVIRGHAVLNLIAVALIGTAWFGYCIDSSSSVAAVDGS